MENMNSFFGIESAEGETPTDYSTAIIKVACILIIGVVILQGVFTASNITANSVFYSAYKVVTDNVTSGYTLVSLMVIVIGAASVLHFLGFM